MFALSLCIFVPIPLCILCLRTEVLRHTGVLKKSVHKILGVLPVVWVLDLLTQRATEECTQRSTEEILVS